MTIMAKKHILPERREHSTCVISELLSFASIGVAFAVTLLETDDEVS